MLQRNNERQTRRMGEGGIINNNNSMNLATHFAIERCGFVSFEELSMWCEKHRIETPKEKNDLMHFLIDKMGARKIKFRWGCGPICHALQGVILLDPLLWRHQQQYGSGFFLIEGDKRWS